MLDNNKPVGNGKTFFIPSFPSLEQFYKSMLSQGKKTLGSICPEFVKSGGLYYRPCTVIALLDFPDGAWR